VFASPGIRLVLRALLAGLATLAASLQGQTLSHAGVVAAITAAAWTVLEYLTPLNQTVGATLTPKAPPGGGA